MLNQSVITNLPQMVTRFNTGKNCFGLRIVKIVLMSNDYKYM